MSRAAWVATPSGAAAGLAYKCQPRTKARQAHLHFLWLQRGTAAAHAAHAAHTSAAHAAKHARQIVVVKVAAAHAAHVAGGAEALERAATGAGAAAAGACTREGEGISRAAE